MTSVDPSLVLRYIGWDLVLTAAVKFLGNVGYHDRNSCSGVVSVETS